MDIRRRLTVQNNYGFITETLSGGQEDHRSTLTPEEIGEES